MEQAILYDFWAEWCPTCKAMEKDVERLAQELPITLIKVNTEEDEELVNKFRVMGLPTFVIERDGEILDMRTGSLSYDKLKKFVEEAISSKFI